MFGIVHAKALLRGALGQQSAVILICMAVDRYMCALYPEKYHQLSSKKVSYVLFIKIHFLFRKQSSTASIISCQSGLIDYIFERNIV